MKKPKGFTLIEIVLVMVMTSIITITFGALLVRVYNFSNRAIDRNSRNEAYLYFRMKLDSQLRNARSEYILITDAKVEGASTTSAAYKDVVALYTDFTAPRWWVGMAPSGSASSYNYSSKPRISRAFAFYYYDQNDKRDVRIEYRFDKPATATPDNPDRRSNIVCTVWDADINRSVSDYNFYTRSSSRYSEIVLSDVVDFMATTHRKPAASGSGTATDGEDSQDPWTILPVGSQGRIHAANIVLYINISMASDVEVPYVREVVFNNRTVRTPYRIGRIPNPKSP